jgi:hypothetical protein
MSGTPLPPQPSNHPRAANTGALHRLATTAPCRYAYPLATLRPSSNPAKGKK